MLFTARSVRSWPCPSSSLKRSLSEVYIICLTDRVDGPGARDHDRGIHREDHEGTKAAAVHVAHHRDTIAAEDVQTDASGNQTENRETNPAGVPRTRRQLLHRN
jgi:hypothetical protein